MPVNIAGCFVPSFEAIEYNEAISDISSVPKLVGYFAIKQFLDPNDPLFKVQMNSALNHAHMSTGKPKEGKNNATQGGCVLCCEICYDKGLLNWAERPSKVVLIVRATFVDSVSTISIMIQ